jgi:PhnB protein
MALINPHINFNGNCEEAFNFYRSAFGGEITRVIRFKDIPGIDPSSSEEDKVMHIALRFGDSMLMGNDVPEAMGRVNEGENRSKINIAAASREEAEKLFTRLSAGGEVEVPHDDSSRDSFFAMFRDKYGIEWIVSFEVERH